MPEEASELMTRATAEIAALKAATFDSLGVTEDRLSEVDGVSFILDGAEAFIKGVEAHTHLLLRPDSDLRGLVALQPAFLPMAIYMAVNKTITDVVEKWDVQAIPLVVRGFMASYSMVAWDSVVESGVEFDPGPDGMPAAFFKVLGISADSTIGGLTASPDSEHGLLPGGLLPDDAPHEVYIGAWRRTPNHGFLVQQTEDGLYEWVHSTSGDDYEPRILARGLERTREKAEEASDAQMVDLAMACVAARDAAIAAAAAAGHVPVPHRPAFMWGSIDDIDSQGYALPIGLGVCAKFEDSTLPLLRVGHHEIARKLILVLASTTGDEQTVRELFLEEAIRQAVKQRRASERPLF